MTIDEMSECERRALHANSMEIYRLLKLIDAGAIPTGYVYIGELIGTLRAEIDRGCDMPMMREMGYLLLELAFPIIPDECAGIRDQIERLLSKIDAGDDIPY